MADLENQGPTSDSPLVGKVEEFIQEAILLLEPDKAGGRGRPRILPALCLWAGLLVCVVRGFSSQLSVWRLLNQRGLWSYPLFLVSDQAVYKRLEKGGIEPLLQILRAVTSLLYERLEPLTGRVLAPFASEVVALDETTLDAVARKLPSLRGEEGPHLPGKLACLFDVRRQLWWDVALIADAKAQDLEVSQRLVEGLPPGSLILADLGYFCFAWFDWLTDRGHYWISRLKANSSYTVRHVFYQEGDVLDAIVWLGAHRSDKAGHAVRLVQFRRGKQLFIYITNVLDPRILSLAEIARLYARRWDIEMAFQVLKQHLKLHFLWSAKQQVMLQQVVAALTIAQILTAIRQEIAARADVDLFEVSLELMVKYFSFSTEKGRDPIAEWAESGHKWGYIRPSRRVKIEAPEIPPDRLSPLPESIELTRKPRYTSKYRVSEETRPN